MMARYSVLLALALLIGCADDNTQSLIITQLDVPDTQSGGCLAPGGGGVFLGSGMLDVYYFTDYAGSPLPSAGYLLFLAVENTLTTQVLKVETPMEERVLDIELTRTDVTLVDAASGGSVGPSFSVPSYKLVKAGETVGVIVEAVPWQTAAALPEDTLILARVRVVGNRSGEVIESNEIEFPIYTCYGCLFRDQGLCTEFEGEGSANPCNIGQDAVAVCCHHSTLGLICPAVKEEAEAPAP